MTEPASTRVALVLAVVPTVLFLAGIPLHDSAPGTCDAWPNCSASARDQWGWTARPWATTGIALGTFLVSVVRIAPWLRQRPVVVRRGSIAALVVLGLVTAAFAVLAVIVWGIDCSDTAWICFGGTEAALALGSPGLLSGVLATLLAVGLMRRDEDRSRLSTWTLAGIAAGVVAVVVGQSADAVLALVGMAFGAD